MELIRNIVYIAVAGLLLVFAWTWFAAFFLGFAVLFGLVWAVGYPIKITKDGHRIGYVRWFTFHRQ